MQPNEYMKGVLETESNNFPEIFERIVDNRKLRLLHASMGMVTEAAELQDMLKKHLFYGKPFDHVNILEEIGDQIWYINIALDALGSSLEEVMQINHDKLFARYKKGFTSEEAINRDLETERKILEGNNVESK